MSASRKSCDPGISSAAGPACPGEPEARVVVTTVRRTLGQWRGRVRMSDDFDAPLPEAELSAWLDERS